LLCNELLLSMMSVMVCGCKTLLLLLVGADQELMEELFCYYYYLFFESGKFC
jgi:hypothetical protein